jgi:hypothetical protein
MTTQHLAMQWHGTTVLLLPLTRDALHMLRQHPGATEWFGPWLLSDHYLARDIVNRLTLMSMGIHFIEEDE